jgi:cytochrome c553
MGKNTSFLIIVLSLWMLVACGNGDGSGASSPEADVAGDATRGEALYKQTSIGAGSAPGCVTCHSLEAGVVLVGPSHAGVGTRAESTVAGQSAAEFLEESILDPNAEVMEGFAAVMYQNYKNDLSDQEVADLVAFLLSLK